MSTNNERDLLKVRNFLTKTMNLKQTNLKKDTREDILKYKDQKFMNKK